MGEGIDWGTLWDKLVWIPNQGKHQCEVTLSPQKHFCKKYNIFAFSFLIMLYNGDHILNIFCLF
jgi:hypothetical protein